MKNKSLISARNNLASLWFPISFLIFIILLLQTIFGKYGDKVDDIWSWYLQTISPTLSLILSVFVAHALGDNIETKTINKFFFKLSFGLSAIYLLVVLFTILMQPFALAYANIKPFELIKKSVLWLGPLQGLMSITIGVFFINTKEEIKEPEKKN